MALDLHLHPIVAQMGPSPEQLPAITECGRSVVVVAGAGSGKTLTLVARYLALLADGLPLRSILAITFTKKAAREMRNRIRRELGRYLAQPDLDDAERACWQTHVDALDAARITTIHSLCTEILRAHPAEAQIDPRFEVLEEGQMNILRGQALDAALAWAAATPETANLFGLLGERNLRSHMDTLLRSRLDARDCFANLPAPVWPAWLAAVMPPLQAFVDHPTVQADFGALAALREDGTLDRAAAAGDKLAEPLATLLALWDIIQAARAADDWATVSVNLFPLRENMKQVGKGANWQPARPKEVIAELQGCYDEIAKPAVGSGIDLALDRQLAEAMPALRAVHDQALAHYTAAKRERQALDFDDLEEGALRLLQEHPAALARWQTELAALLVDEYQDTNRRQNALVGLLDGGTGKRFLVGDAKQSIYRFRGADVSVFRGERDALAESGGREVTLATSYRGHAALIHGLNHCLPPALPAGADNQPYREPFAPLAYYRESPVPGCQAPHIELQLALGSKSEGALDAAAAALAGRLIELVEDAGILLPAAGTPRPLEYGDIAILCRSASSFGPYEDALEAAGIPFLTVAGRGFYGRPEVRDLLNALAALADPTDDLALAGLLRSPTLQLSDAALYRLTQTARTLAGGAAARPSLWDTVAAIISAPEAPPAPWPVLHLDCADAAAMEHRLLARAHKIIKRLHEQAGRITVAELLKAFLDATGYQAALLAAGQPRAARNVAKLLADTHASGIVSAGEFLAYVTGLRDAGTREGEARSTAEGAVQIMSVHAAKGLEFPVVVVGDIAHQARARSGDLLLDRQRGLLLPLAGDPAGLPAIYRLGKAQEQDQDDAESGRLFYVAATRAREHLILNGCAARNAGGDLRRNGGWLDSLLKIEDLDLKSVPTPDSAGSTYAELALAGGAVGLGCHFYGLEYTCARRARSQAHVEGSTLNVAKSDGQFSTSSVPDLPTALIEPRPNVRHSTFNFPEAPADIVPDSVRPQRVWRVVPVAERPTAPAWVIGSIVHAALAAWRFPDPGFHAWAEARARTYGLTDREQLADAASRTAHFLKRFRASYLYRDMADAEKRLHEVPYCVTLSDGSPAYRIVDALFRSAGAWTLVEFKTDRIPPAEREQWLERSDYRTQAEEYAQAVQRLLDLPQPPRTLLCLLNCGDEVCVETVQVAPSDA
jgi:ATP-dependent helicase/nuclease subunit A